MVLRYIANMEVFLSQRTLAWFGHPGFWTTETTHLSGAYDSSDYGCGSREGWPDWLMQSDYLHVDQGGDSGMPEMALMVPNYMLYTGNVTAAAPYLRSVFRIAE